MYPNHAINSSFMEAAVIQMDCQPKRNNSPILLSWSDSSLIRHMVAFLFSIQILLVTNIQLVVKWNLQGCSYFRCSKVRAAAPHFLIPVQLKHFMLMKEYISVASHLIVPEAECFTNLHFLIIQHLAFSESCHFHIGLILFPGLHTDCG